MIKAIITTIDNLPNNKEQVRILKDDPLIDEIIVVNNGSIDSTQEWLSQQNDITVIDRKNRGAGLGRNAGLDKAAKFDYVLMLDGGIRPLVNGVEKMLNYLLKCKEADVIGIEIADFETDYDKAWRRWPYPIKNTYRNTRLSHTAYCLARHKAFGNIRFCEEGPFNEPGWGCDDDEIMCQWSDNSIVLHVVTGVHPYRRASGSFRRLYNETGIWPNQYGSVYEKRLVWLQQNYPQYEHGTQWGEPWLTIIIKTNCIEQASILIIEAHKKLRERSFAPPWQDYPNPYSIILNTQNDEVLEWAKPRCLRQFHGDTLIVNKKIIRHESMTEGKDFRVNQEVRPNAYYHTSIKNQIELQQAIEKYNEVYPRQLTKIAPKEITNGRLI